MAELSEKYKEIAAVEAALDAGNEAIEMLFEEKKGEEEDEIEIAEFKKNYNAETGKIVSSSNNNSCYSIVRIPRGAVSINFFAYYVTSNFGYGIYDNVEYDENYPPIARGIYNQLISESGRIDVEIPEGATYIVLSERKDQNTKIVWTINGKAERYLSKENLKDICPASVKSSAIGGGASVVKAVTMSATTTLSLDDYPQGGKKGDRINFYCDVDNFNGITICKGYDKAYGGRWFEINGTSVTLHSKSGDSDVSLETVAHNLSFSAFLYINVSIDDDGVAKLIIKTKTGIFEHNFDGWGLNSRGLVEVRNNGSTLRNCVLSANNVDFRCPIWYFGASWEDVSDNRVWGQLRKMGYYKFYANAWSGRSGSELLGDLKLALKFGTPKMLIAIIANMPIDTEAQINNYKTLLGSIKSLCDDNGIELVVRTHPNTAEKNYDEAINPFVRSSGVRIVDYHKAMKDPNKNWEYGEDNADNYDGYMVSSHPTIAGAEALSLRVLTDIPELMQL